MIGTTLVTFPVGDVWEDGRGRLLGHLLLSHFSLSCGYMGFSLKKNHQNVHMVYSLLSVLALCFRKYLLKSNFNFILSG